MSEFMFVCLIVFSVLSIYLFVFLRNKGGISYFKTAPGKNSIYGILLQQGYF